jgi:hypothetical protein
MALTRFLADYLTANLLDRAIKTLHILYATSPTFTSL